MTSPTPPVNLELGTYNWMSFARVERQRVIIHICDDGYVDEPSPADLNAAQCRALAEWLTRAAEYLETQETKP